MDEKYLEQASRLEETDRLNGVAKARRSLQRPDNFNGECVDCEEVIPLLRLNTGAWRCVECQEHFEKVSKIQKMLPN